MARITAAGDRGRAARCKLIVQFGAGLDGVDRAAAEARGIAVRNVPGANAQAVAELALFLMLALARRLPAAPALVRRPAWWATRRARELPGKTLGIVGLGATGRALARIARGLGMDVIALRRQRASADDPGRGAGWAGRASSTRCSAGPTT